MGKPAPVFMTDAHTDFTPEELRNLAIVVPIELTLDQLGMISGILMAEVEEEGNPLDMRHHFADVALEIDRQVTEYADAHPELGE